MRDFFDRNGNLIKVFCAIAITVMLFVITVMLGIYIDKWLLAYTKLFGKSLFML